MVLRTILFILLMTKNLHSDASGFDAYSSCYRRSRMQQDLPCDFGSQTWCTIPGNSYPWHAVRRFVHENQGLMRRMYGDERHISVLRAELESNDIEFFDSPLVKEEFRRRYSKDMDRTKEFVRMFMKTEGRKFSGDGKTEGMPGRPGKVKKSIDQASNNVLYQTNMKSSKDEDVKGPSANGIGNKTLPKMAAATSTTTTTTTTTVTPPPTVMETTYGTFTGETTVNFTTIATTTTTESPNSTPYRQTDPTAQPTPRTEPFITTISSNDTQYDETYDYDLETEEPYTTTPFDDPTTTEAYVEDAEPQNHKNEPEQNYPEPVQETRPIQDQATKAPVSPEPSAMIRLKGINACPVKEEVVAPFWANNTRGEVLALLNLYPFEQYVHWEKCMYEHKQMFCREGCRCEQQYRLHRLLAYDPNNECRGIFSDWFRFPSCCVCKCYDLPMEFRLTSRSPRIQELDFYEKLSSPFSHSSSESAFKRFAQPEKQQEEKEPPKQP